ncbi:MAG: hypothetical protein J6T15_01430 [Bacilli bacterium]|nr:hypothetical protein [Bacilli bacterium]
MSEIKGQLLGIILVLAIFGIVGAALKSAFTNMKDTVVEQVENVSTSVGTMLTYNS